MIHRQKVRWLIVATLVVGGVAFAVWRFAPLKDNDAQDPAFVDGSLCDRMTPKQFGRLKIGMTRDQAEAMFGPAENSKALKETLAWREGSEWKRGFEELGPEAERISWWLRSLGWYCEDSFIQILIDDRGRIKNARYVHF